MIELHNYYAHGKLLISGEYAVLDGALALAAPTRFGQSMQVSGADRVAGLHWDSYDEKGKLWFTGRFSLPGMLYEEGSDAAIGQRLSTILTEAARQGSAIRNLESGRRVATRLEFPRSWGLGSSSSLISLIAQWTGADPYRLLEASFGGSGYDLACATADGPILFQRMERRAHSAPFPFQPAFHEQLYFVYLGQKQDSRAGIHRYREYTGNKSTLVEHISELTLAMGRAADLDAFEAALREHETLIANALALPKVKPQRFADYWGEVKSLGAWGGDFALLTSRRSPEETHRYLSDRGYEVVFSFREMVYP